MTQFLPLYMKDAAMSQMVRVTARGLTGGLECDWGQELKPIPNFSIESYGFPCTCSCEAGQSANRHTKDFKGESELSVGFTN